MSAWQIVGIGRSTADGFGAAFECLCRAELRCRERGTGIRKGYIAAWLCVGAWGLLITAAFVFFPEMIARCFFHEPEAIAIAVEYRIIIGFSEAFMSVELTDGGSIVRPWKDTSVQCD